VKRCPGLEPQLIKGAKSHMQSTELARGNINRAHELSVTLEQPEGTPAVVLIH
jgi:hypothetical protein